MVGRLPKGPETGSIYDNSHTLFGSARAHTRYISVHDY